MRERQIDSPSYIGMFDLIKGIGMIFIILGHTINNYFTPGKDSNILLLMFGVGYMLLGSGLIQTFFLMSGYGFRKGSVLGTIWKQGRMMLKPYVYITVATAVLHFITRYVMCHSVKVALEQTWSVVGGFLFALSSNKKMFGTLFYFCGTMWYIVALFIGWIVLNILMNVVKERYIPVVVWLCASVGWLLGRGRVIPFCIPQGLITVVYLYYGYRIKKARLFTKNCTKGQIAFAVVACIATLGVTAVSGRINSMADGVWNAGLLSIWLDGYVGYLIIYLSLKLNRFKGRIWNLLKRIGSNSMFIFTVHTVELHGIPWWQFTEYMNEHRLLGCLVHFVLRCVIIIGGVYIYKCIMRKNYKRKAFHKAFRKE